ncbi:MAG: hypothetical protein LBE91_16460 [Tannerella sp.]|jgi:hypothetical protein|nr:hypothetical protein [Tannerella sp.]
MRKTRTLSDETKRKISNAMRGNRNPNYGRPLSANHRHKIRLAMIDYWKSINKQTI